MVVMISGREFLIVSFKIPHLAADVAAPMQRNKWNDVHDICQRHGGFDRSAC